MLEVDKEEGIAGKVIGKIFNSLLRKRTRFRPG